MKKPKQFLSIFSGFLVAGLMMTSCKKDAQAPLDSKAGNGRKPLEKEVEIRNSQSHLDQNPNAIPIKDRRRTTAYFRKLLNDQGIHDEKIINSFLQEQERQMMELEGINGFKKYRDLKQQQMQEWQNSEAMHGSCVVADPWSTGGVQYQPIITPGWTSGYGPGVVTRYDCSHAKAEYTYYDHAAGYARFLHTARLAASKSAQTEMAINFYPEGRPWTYKQGYAVVQIYQYGANNQWYLILSQEGAVGDNPGLQPWIRPNLLHVTTDNWRCYSINVSTLGQVAWWGPGDNVWKGSASGFYVEDDDIYYNPPCWVTNTCPNIGGWW